MKTVSLALVVYLFSLAMAWADDTAYNKFFGHYVGEVTLADGLQRKLDVVISKPKKEGFNVRWETVSLDQTGETRAKSYSIDFLESDRKGIYGSAMKTNLFGGRDPLDPMKGEPYFWARINDNTLTVYGMLIRPDGGYEIQRYDRHLEGDKLQANYTLFSEGESIKKISATLVRK